MQKSFSTNIKELDIQQYKQGQTIFRRWTWGRMRAFNTSWFPLWCRTDFSRHAVAIVSFSCSCLIGFGSFFFGACRLRGYFHSSFTFIHRGAAIVFSHFLPIDLAREFVYIIQRRSTEALRSCPLDIRVLPFFFFQQPCLMATLVTGRRGETRGRGRVSIGRPGKAYPKVWLDYHSICRQSFLLIFEIFIPTFFLN